MIYVVLQVTTVDVEWGAILVVGVKELRFVLLTEAVKMVAEALQIRLPLSEECQAKLWHVFCVVEAEGVGPFEDFAALDDGLISLLEEAQLAWWIAFVIV